MASSTTNRIATIAIVFSCVALCINAFILVDKYYLAPAREEKAAIERKKIYQEQQIAAEKAVEVFKSVDSALAEKYGVILDARIGPEKVEVRFLKNDRFTHLMFFKVDDLRKGVIDQPLKHDTGEKSES